MEKIKLIDVARRTGFSYQWIYHQVWEGKLKAHKVAGRWLISEAEAERFIKERKARLG